MGKDSKKFLKKKASKLTPKHHIKPQEESEKLKIVANKIEEGFRQKQGDVMKKRKSRAAKKVERVVRKKSAWKSFWKKYFSF